MSNTSRSEFLHLPHEVHIHIGTFLRAYDLAQLQQSCTHFSLKFERRFVHSIIDVFANHVYPPELTQGYETTPPLFGTHDPVKKAILTSPRKHHSPRKNGKQESLTQAGDEVAESEAVVLTFEHLRDMEMLVLMRLLIQPEPPIGSLGAMGSLTGYTLMEDGTEDYESEDKDQSHHYYVSKSWCKAALKWLESQEEERRRKEVVHTHIAVRAGGGKGNTQRKSPKKISRKQQRMLSRRLSDVSPPWPNANQDLLCPHGELMRHSSKAARSKRRVMDKHAWKVLRRLYPESVPLTCRSLRPGGGGDVMDSDACLQCWAQCESEKRSQEQYKLLLEQERKKPLADPLIRAFYVRASRGVPHDRVVRCNALSQDAKPSATPTVPLLPGVYHLLPRTWCQRWRKYMKSGGIDKHTACLPPDATDILCGVHKLPLLPPHLEQYLRGESPGGVLFPSSAASASRLEQEDINHSFTGYVQGEATASLGGVVSPARANNHTHDSDTTGITAALLAVAAADGISAINVERELETQRTAMAQMGTASAARSPSFSASVERDCQTLVEIVTDEEFSALEQEFWPRMAGTCFTLRFDIASAATSAGKTQSTVEWFYTPCRECENDDLINMMRQDPDCIERCMVVRNRVRNSLETNHSSTGENWKWKKAASSEETSDKAMRGMKCMAQKKAGRK